MLRDKVAVVTGASSGIGRAMAIALAARGCRVVAAARSHENLIQLCAEIGENAIPVKVDISSRQDVDRMFKVAVDQFGSIDILIANAGIFSQAPFADIDAEVIDDQIDVNLRGTMHCVHAAIPHLKGSDSGDVVIIGSIAGVTELPNEAVYSSTKHAVQAFAHILRRQLRETGVRVGLVSPGTVATPLWGEKSEAEIEAQINRHEAVRAEDVVEAALYMLTQPRHVAIRDIVILPQGQDL